MRGRRRSEDAVRERQGMREAKGELWRKDMMRALLHVPERDDRKCSGETRKIELSTKLLSLILDIFFVFNPKT